MFQNRWNRKEETYLTKNYGNRRKTLAEIANHLNRTVDSVTSKARSLYLRRPNSPQY